MYQYGFPPQTPPVIIIRDSDLNPSPTGKPRRGFGLSKKEKKLNIVEELARIDDTRRILEAWYQKKDEKPNDKKDDKSKMRTYTFLETLGLMFIFGIPYTGMMFLVFKTVTAN